MEYLIILFRTIVFLITLVGVYKLFNKKSLRIIRSIDLIIMFFLISISSYFIFNDVIFTYYVFIVILVVVVRMGYYYYNLKFGNKLIVEDKVIVSHGRLNFHEVVKNDIDFNRILYELKKKNIKSIEEVELMFLDGNNFVIFKRDNDICFPLPIIVDGVIFDDTLLQIKKSREWLYKNISSNNLLVNDIVYGFYKDDSLVLIKKENVG